VLEGCDRVGIEIEQLLAKERTLREQQDYNKEVNFIQNRLSLNYHLLDRLKYGRSKKLEKY